MSQMEQGLHSACQGVFRSEIWGGVRRGWSAACGLFRVLKAPSIKLVGQGLGDGSAQEGVQYF